MRFEEKLRKQMLLKGFNQQKLSRASGVSDSEISRILNGKSQPGLENALKLARAVGVSLDYLADDSVDEDPAREVRDAATWEGQVLELATEIGPAMAVLLLQNARFLGVELAMRRLMGIERPVIEVGDAPAPARSARPSPGTRTA